MLNLHKRLYIQKRRDVLLKSFYIRNIKFIGYETFDYDSWGWEGGLRNKFICKFYLSNINLLPNILIHFLKSIPHSICNNNFIHPQIIMLNVTIKRFHDSLYFNIDNLPYKISIIRQIKGVRIDCTFTEKNNFTNSNSIYDIPKLILEKC